VESDNWNFGEVPS